MFSDMCPLRPLVHVTVIVSEGQSSCDETQIVAACMNTRSLTGTALVAACCSSSALSRYFLLQMTGPPGNGTGTPFLFTSHCKL